jgi:hypothetical protein
MAVSGLVLNLSPVDDLASRALVSLSRDPRITIGERFGRRLAAVAQTESPQADRDLWDDLHATPGVEYVDVTFVALDDPATAQENSHAHD